MIDSFTGRWFFLSNFYPIIIEHQGIKYPSVEHYYVAMKIKDDQMIDGRFVPFIDCREMLSKIPKAADVKRIGRSLKIRKDWDVIKLSIMEWGVREKFKDEKLSEMLLSTIGEEIVEGNFWNDTFTCRLYDYLRGLPGQCNLELKLTASFKRSNMHFLVFTHVRCIEPIG